MPQESIRPIRWSEAVKERNTASAIGERQILPRQTKRTEIGREAAVEVLALVPSADTRCFCGECAI